MGKSAQKPNAGTFSQQLVVRQFLKIVAVVICELIALTPKTVRQQREMIRTVLRQFFQNLETICNPSLYGVFFLNRNYVPCNVTENPKTKDKSLLSTSSAGQ